MKRTSANKDIPLMIVKRATTIRNEIVQNFTLKTDIGIEYDWIPKPYFGNSIINVIIIGQDPTIQNINSRKNIQTVLNLDKKNSLYIYVNIILSMLGFTMNNLYATNLYKCFFNNPPGKNTRLLSNHLEYWIDLIKEEIDNFPNAVIFTLGEPVIKQLILNNFKKVSYYWDYIGKTTSGNRFSMVASSDNLLNRNFYPLPHQPSYTRNKFYNSYLSEFIEFVKTKEKII